MMGLLIFPSVEIETPAFFAAPISPPAHQEILSWKLWTMPFVEIQLHRDPGDVKGLVQANKTAEQSLLQAALDDGRREPFGKVAVDRRRIRIFLIFGIRIRSGFVNSFSYSWFASASRSVVSVSPLGVTSNHGDTKTAALGIPNPWSRIFSTTAAASQPPEESP